MSRKQKRSRKKRYAVSKNSNVVWKQSSEEATLAQKPRYNAYACGHGVHGSTKYNRAQEKRNWRKQIGQEGASRGSFLFRTLRP